MICSLLESPLPGNPGFHAASTNAQPNASCPSYINTSALVHTPSGTEPESHAGLARNSPAFALSSSNVGEGLRIKSFAATYLPSCQRRITSGIGSPSTQTGQ